MEGEFGSALMLLVVGMVTVFSILFLVVIFGKLLISTVNKYFPAPEIQPISTPSHSSDLISAGKMAAIVAAVDIVSDGKANINKVEKL
ncbi:OadG family protein [Flexithrix dorotheae]|uniref:OadG family protein n=1 Tax=Flexithrix dorotheae TaxID=70993 RepID=UPI000376D9C9|nr:OadG family protein [Flexithrix dorotheae]